MSRHDHSNRVMKGIFGTVLILGVITGCGDSDPVRPQPAALALNDTPANTVMRFVQTYEQRRIAEYRDLFTSDFVFEFSNTTDPGLVAQWPDGWTANDEELSARHLFQGFTDGAGYPHAAASTIDVNLSSATPQPDDSRPDPTKFHYLLTAVNGTVVIPASPPETEPTTYLINNNVHRFFLVRGDSAQLTAGQMADSTRWYIYRWRDETSGIVALRATRPSTWGRMKAIYR